MDEEEVYVLCGDEDEYDVRVFVDSHGDPGHFMLQTKAYDRAGLPCVQCKTPIKQITQGQRSTYFCSKCQKK